MPQSYFKLNKNWFDGDLWVIPGDYQNMAFCETELLKIYDGGDYIIAAIRNYPFYLHGQNPVHFSGFLCSQF